MPIVVYTAGVFDILHRGHLNFLWNSAMKGDILVVGVVSDDGCKAYKGFKPRESQEERMKRIERLPHVNLVVPQWGTDPSENLRQFRPDIFTHADDWTKLKEGQETLEELGIRWVTFPYTKGISSTLLRAERPALEP